MGKECKDSSWKLNIRYCWIIIAFIFIVFALPIDIVSFAHDRDGHDDDLEYVLFGDTEYKETHPKDKEIIQAIEDATYLCVDQFNGNGQDALNNLQDRDIPDIPKSISEIDFRSNYTHRSETHRGWNVNYQKSNWEVRKKILYNTVEMELFSSEKSLFSSFVSWIKGENSSTQLYKKKCESFCILLYYTHIIGDHIEANKASDLNYVAPLAQLHDRDNPGVIPDLISCCDELFVDQLNTYTYIEFKQELENLRDESDKLVNSKGGINTEEKFAEYHQYAIDLRELMGCYIPKLLENEEFFANVF